jgi:hypothetical protein
VRTKRTRRRPITLHVLDSHQIGSSLSTPGSLGWDNRTRWGFLEHEQQAQVAPAYGAMSGGDGSSLRLPLKRDRSDVDVQTRYISHHNVSGPHVE